MEPGLGMTAPKLLRDCMRGQFGRTGGRDDAALDSERTRIMRFILKCAFWLGLVAFLLPFGQHSGETETEISWLGAFAGAEEALQDLGGFCDRAPRACDTGREIALFASERVAGGIAIAYDFFDTRRPDATDVAETTSARKPGGEASSDPLMTGGVSSSEPAASLPRAYMAPKRAAPAAVQPSTQPVPAAVPTPAPRV